MGQGEETSEGKGVGQEKQTWKNVGKFEDCFPSNFTTNIIEFQILLVRSENNSVPQYLFRCAFGSNLIV